MKEFTKSHLVKSAELNHHGTLFAGKSAEWLVESAFIVAAVEHGRPQDVLCINVHGFIFKEPAKSGDIFTIKSRIAKLGTTSITVYVEGFCEIEKVKNVEGFVTFVCLEPDTKVKRAHGLVLDEPSSEAEKIIREKALKL